MPEIRLEARSDTFLELETEPVRGGHEATPMWTPHKASPVCGEQQEHFSRRSLAQEHGRPKPRVCVNLLSAQVMSKADKVAALLGLVGRV